MSAIRAFLKKTPLLPLWKKAKQWYPIKKALSLENRIHKTLTLKIYYPYLYRKYAKQPVDPNKVVFVEIRLPELTNSFQTLYKAVDAEGKYDIHKHFLRQTFVTRKEYDRRSIEFVKDIATAKYVFANEASNVLSCVPKRKETIVTQTWHGCGAFKKFGFSTADKIFGGSYKDQLKYPFYKNYNHVTISSPEVAWAYEEAMHLQETPEIIKPIGTSRTDVFYDQEFHKNAFEKLYRIFPEAKGKKVILYAPTFRGRVANGLAPTELDIEKFMAAFEGEYVLLTKHHPLVRELPEIPKKCASFAKDVTREMQIDDLICVSDICISDYSSLIFEYSLLERPMIFFAYDRSDYDDWRGFYYNYDDMTPGPICMTNEEMIDYIQNIDERFNKQEVIDFKYKFMRSCDGHATERIMDLVFGESREKGTPKTENEKICETKTELVKLVDQICKDHNLNYFAFANLLIGAVHYQDFIPDEASREWDLGLVREDYDKLLDILRSYKFPQGIRFTEVIPPKNRRPRSLPFLEKTMNGEWYHIRLCAFDHIPADYFERQAFMEHLQVMEDAYNGKGKKNGLKGKALFYLSVLAKPYTKRKKEIEAFASSKKTDERATYLQSVVLHKSKLVEQDRVFPLQKIAFRDMQLSVPKDVTLWTPVQDEELQKQVETIQEVSLIILKKLDEICNKLGIGYFICNGTMLGAVRNGGFIPWDDDIDIGMLRADYDRFLKEAGEYLDDRFFLQSSETDPYHPYLYSKLRVNYSEYVTPFIHRLKCHRGIGIDLFPFDYMPNDDKEKEAFLKDIYEKAQVHIDLAHAQQEVYPEDLLEPRDEEERANRKKYQKRLENYQKQSLQKTRADFLKVATRYNNEAEAKGLTTVASFIISYTYIKTEDLLPYGKTTFEGLTVSVPKKPEVFLEMQYSDFMTLPKKHQRIGHKVLRWSVDMDKLKREE